MAREQSTTSQSLNRILATACSRSSSRCLETASWYLCCSWTSSKSMTRLSWAYQSVCLTWPLSTSNGRWCITLRSSTSSSSRFTIERWLKTLMQIYNASLKIPEFRIRFDSRCSNLSSNRLLCAKTISGVPLRDSSPFDLTSTLASPCASWLEKLRC